ncbi:MAG TPA: hypothetical protein VNM16_00450 [Bacillota bacterium]|nr:hypothetical protein [Bacillota bacterium]
MSAPIVMIFEGGGAAGPIARDLQRVRDAVARRLARIWELAGARVLLISDRLPEATHRTAADFHFGRTLQALLRRYAPERVVIMGGAALPLLRSADARRILARLQRLEGGFLANNLFSPDLVAVSPASALLRIPAPDTDNQIGLRLLDAGLKGVALPDRARFKLDLDTPADAGILASDPECPPDVAVPLREIAWIPALAERAAAVERALRQPGAELTVIGRVGPPVLSFIDQRLRCSTRVVAEERGMRALGREQAGLARSLLAPWLEAVGPDAFFAALGQGAAVFDDRVLLAHWRRPFTEEERFAADAGAVDGIADERLRDLVRAAGRAPMPVLLGGHSIVYGGLWRLAERALASREAAA